MSIAKVEVAASYQDGRKGLRATYEYEGSTALIEFELVQLVIEVLDTKLREDLERVFTAVRRELNAIESERDSELSQT